MSNKSPIFPMPEPHHFSDYGFDPQINYFQVLEEAMKHKRETATGSTDSVHFKLQKPISKDDSKKAREAKKQQKWWKNALFFFKWRWTHQSSHLDQDKEGEVDVHRARARALRASISGPVYWTESRIGFTTPHRTSSRPSSGPLAGTFTPDKKGEVSLPYLSLRDLTMVHHYQPQQHRMSTSAVPMYLVT